MKRRQKNTLSLKKSVFIRLILIACGAVLLFYLIGLTAISAGLKNTRDDLQASLQARCDYVADQLDQEFDRLNFFMLELMSNSQLLRYAFSYPVMDDYQRMVAIKGLASQEYMIKRSTTLAESVQIMLPDQMHTVISDQALYNDLDPAMWEALISLCERNRVKMRVWNDQMWMLLPRYDLDKPLFLIAISISPQALKSRMESLLGEPCDVFALTWDDHMLSAGDESLLSESRREPAVFSALSALKWGSLTLSSRALVDEQMAPFAAYRWFLWLITLLALILLVAVFLYYRIYIMRPINDIFDTMRRAGKDGRYRIPATTGTDYDDIYAQFNDMVEHIETLAGKVYEEQYRAQKAELKQLQMQIDPHFLYNSLYLIYRIAQAEGNKSIAGIALNLSNYYRYITKMPEQIVLLKDEINHVTNYLEIQRVRFEPRVRILVQPLPDEIAQERIPSLIIQPIVENAFQHGVKDRLKDGLVTLKYHVDPDSFQVIVADNSGRMDDEKVLELWKRVTDPASTESSALKNLYRRLQLYEGSGHELQLACVDGGLTTILTFRRRGLEKEARAD